MAFGNFEGGRLLLGVENDGTVSGLDYGRHDACQLEE